ncbi:MAG: glycosyltransferase [Microthrixaceae bacterium]
MTRQPSVLFTVHALARRRGTELYTRDIAMEFRRRSWPVAVYSPTLGEVAGELVTAGVNVTDDLRSLREPPDIIHAQHHGPTLDALDAFPHTPAIMMCHGFRPWEEEPVLHPRVVAHLAVCDAARQRLAESGIPAADTTLVPNFVALDRFPRRDPLPPQPRRAMVFSNYAAPGSTYASSVQSACEQRSIAVELLGEGSGTVTPDPATLLGAADVVFAQGRSALEALACGAAVVVASSRGLGPMVTSANLASLRGRNFGLHALEAPMDADQVARRLDAYDQSDATLVTDQVRSNADVGAVATTLEAIYRRAMTGTRNGSPPLDQEALDHARQYQLAPRTRPTYQELAEGWHQRGPAAQSPSARP